MHNFPNFHGFASWAREHFERSVGKSVPAVSAAFISPDGKISPAANGYADYGERKPVSVDSIFQVASISKTITAYAVARLVDRGSVAIDDPVESHLTSWVLPESRWRSDEVTIRRILSHRAGLSLHGYWGIKPDYPLPTLVESLSGETKRSATASQPTSVTIEVEPGTEVRYSGGGFTILQLMIEEVSGEAFSSFAQREVLEPLDMSSSSFVEFGPDRQRLAIGHDGEGNGKPNFLFAAKAAAGLYSTASDLARLLVDCRRGCTGAPALLQTARYVEITKQYAEVPEQGFSSGLGCFVEEMSDGSLFVGNSGGNIGWTCYFGINKTHGDGFSIVTNSNDGYCLVVEPVLEAYRNLRAI